MTQTASGHQPELETDLDRYAHTHYQLRKKVFRVFGDDFQIFDADGDLAFYSRLKAFRLREDIRVYADPDKERELLVIKARTSFDFGTAYDVTDAVSGEYVGVLRRKGFSSMFRDEWAILDTDDNERGTILEDSATRAMVRRILDLSFLWPQAFHATIGDAPVAHFQQRFNPFVAKIDLDFSADEDILLDRRLGIAAAILLCAIEGRQD
ncbi:LURP-one-related/scramblase family protein [Mucisphaera calidilacus]|uniref:Uncharacterized protein n=1 Tax=Mucisphaera calidilacus TaxID=2527982 RepID=A0A518BYQ1_9BACT|nr:hypothetical protein [Mucisphaera calidilacus]QDU72103.1 hypothetical protein Pan265_19650 [Mucisphaera calidilacus]